MFAHDVWLCEGEPQKPVAEMIKVFGNNIDKKRLMEKCNIFTSDLHCGDRPAFEFICKQIDLICENSNNPECVEDVKNTLKEYIKKRTSNIKVCFADIESLSYQNGFKDAFKFFTELTN